MNLVDIDSLLSEVSADHPAGENLEYDEVFVAVERAAEIKPDQVLGDSIAPGEPADWKAVLSGVVELSAKTKDLRLAVYLTRALLNLHGWAGMQQGVQFIRALLEKYWEVAHPELDPDDDLDPTLRINTIITLCDRDATLNAMLDAPLVDVKGLGVFNLRDYKIATGEISRSVTAEGSTPDEAIIMAAFSECDIEAVKMLSQKLVSLREDATVIDALLLEKTGSAKAPDMKLLHSVINDAHKLVQQSLTRRGESIPMSENATSENGSSETAATAQVSSVKVAAGEIGSRADAARMMDKISEYFIKHEPSSPVPLLMQRAKRLSSLGFLEILKDLAPDGLSQAQHIGGVSQGNE